MFTQFKLLAYFDLFSVIISEKFGETYMNLLLKFSFFLGLFLSPTIFAEEQTKILTTTVETYLTRTSKVNPRTGKKNATVAQDWYWNFTLPQSFDLEFYIGGIKSIEGASYHGDLNDAYVQLQKNIFKSDFLTFNLSARFIAPISEEARDITFMNWGMQLRPTFLFSLYKDARFNITYRLRPIYNEYSYSQEYDSGGKYNIQRTFVVANRLGLVVDGALYFFLVANFTTQWNTNDDHIDDNWSTTQLVGYNISSNYYVEFAHTTRNRFYDDQGRRINIDIFDNTISSYTLNVGVTF